MTDKPPAALNLGDPATYHQAAQYPLEVGDVVYDIRSLVMSTTGSPAEVAVVVDTHDSTVECHDFERDGERICLADYELNRLYADFDRSERVVTIAWASLLDGLVPQWREHRGNSSDMVAYFDRMATDWDVSVRAHESVYDYPESRLIADADAPTEALP